MTYITRIPADASAVLKGTEALAREILGINKEQLREQQKLIEELRKISPILPLYSGRVTFGTTVESVVLGPWNLSNYSLLSGYFKEPGTGVMIRVEYRNGAYPEGGFMGEDEWLMSSGWGLYSQFHLPILGPFVRMFLQGQLASFMSLTMQADNNRGLPKYQASQSPLFWAEYPFTGAGSLAYAVNDVISGPINYHFTCTGGGNFAIIFACYRPPLFTSTDIIQVNWVPTASYTTQGQIFLPPYPLAVTLLNQTATAQSIQCLLWQ